MFSLLVAFLVQPQFTYASVEGLKAGDASPIENLKGTDGKTLNLTEKDKNYILVFYRGSWCPYCMTQLKSIQEEIIPKLDETSKLLAISVDKPKVAKKMKRNFSFTFHVVSDPKADILKKFNIANKLEDKLIEKYKNSYQIDVEGDSGQTHHIVAHPAVFIVRNRKIVFADVHTNYKERTENKSILSAIKK